MLMMKTIRTGERVAVWDRQGAVEFVSGPRRLVLWKRTVEPLARHAAGADEYLVIAFKDGHSEHLRGPAAVWFHPVEHEAIRVEKAIPLDANEALVVYRQGQERIERRIVRGPELFVPAANEWLHEFAWHGSTPADPRHKHPRALRFTKLRVIPDQMYCDVEEVRTADDALVTVQLMVFFELLEIEVMLGQTHDPVADFLNAVTADVIDFAATRSFERFKEQTELLSDLETYPQLCGRAGRIGYRINKVVYRGYHANARLQGMHDSAIEARTKLKLEAETERQAQELADLRLEREAQRTQRQQEMAEGEVNHRNRLKQVEHEQQLRLMQMEHEQQLRQEQGDREQQLRLQQAEAMHELEQRRKRNEMELEHRRAMYRERAAYLGAMQSMQVDLTSYLVARHQHVDRVIRIEGGENGENGRAQLHLHERQ